uniref:Uncharacterized protein n=1 Tax=Salix viminalis TaxID=40686 RepID=A0A6N2NLJ0_SALVM
MFLQRKPMINSGRNEMLRGCQGWKRKKGTLWRLEKENSLQKYSMQSESSNCKFRLLLKGGSKGMTGFRHGMEGKGSGLLGQRN